MSYKKYIKRGDRVYGPYIYQSSREDGKVVSNYYGRDNNKKLFLILGVAFIILLSLLSLLNNQNLGIVGFTGKSVLETTASYVQDQPLQGGISYSLKNGELIPSETKVIVSMNGEEHSYSLSEIVSETPIEGNYYLDGKNIEGSGAGFGTIGTKTSYPNIAFSLNILPSGEISTPETPVEPEVPVENETPVENPTPTINESTENPETPTENETPVEPEVPVETPTEIPVENEIPSITGGTTENPETPVETETPVEDTETITEQTTTETTTETPETPTEGNPINLITGAVTRFFSSNIFSAITFRGLTGRAVDENTGATTINGEVSADKPFEYNLNDGESAEIVANSVRLNGEVVPEDTISLAVEGNKATVTTDYKIIEEGFGTDYLSDSSKELKIDLSKLDIEGKQGELVVKFVYNNNEIASTSLTLLEEGVNVSATENITTIENKTPVELEKVADFELTSKELDMLVNSTGTSTVSMSKADIVNKRLVVKFDIGTYWIENSYVYSGAISEGLKYQIELDKAKFKKKLAMKLIANSENQVSSQDILKQLQEELAKGITAVNATTQQNATEQTTETTNETIETEETPTETPEQTNTTIEEITEENVSNENMTVTEEINETVQENITEETP